MSEPFIGEIRAFGFTFAPRGWALCDGQLLAIAQHSALFSLLGTTYGGNGTTTFALPDLRGRGPVHHGSGPGLSPVTQGQVGGSETTVLTTNNMPAHTHDVAPAVSDGARTTDRPNGGVPARGGYYADSGSATGAPATTTSTGGAQPFSTRDPYLAVLYAIALQGIFPSRP